MNPDKMFYDLIEDMRAVTSDMNLSEKNDPRARAVIEQIEEAYWKWVKLVEADQDPDA